ncbi:MAG: hypothetical protein ACRC6U_07390 [Fusobacteriaceae bacterium]
MAKIGDKVTIADEFLPYYKQLGIIDLDLGDKIKISESGGNPIAYVSLNEIRQIVNQEIKKLEKKYDTEIKRLKSQIDTTYANFTKPQPNSNQNQPQATEAQQVIPSS